MNQKNQKKRNTKDKNIRMKSSKNGQNPKKKTEEKK